VNLEKVLYSARNARIATCKRCIRYSNSVRLSVRHTPVLCQNDGTLHGAVCTVRQQNVSSFVETKKYSAGMTLPPEILAPSDLLTPEGSEF